MGEKCTVYTNKRWFVNYLQYKLQFLFVIVSFNIGTRLPPCVKMWHCTHVTGKPILC